MPTSWQEIYAALCDALFIYLFKKSKKKRVAVLIMLPADIGYIILLIKLLIFFLFTKSCYVYLTLDFSRNKNFLGTKEIVCVFVGSAQ